MPSAATSSAAIASPCAHVDTPGAPGARAPAPPHARAYTHARMPIAMHIPDAHATCTCTRAHLRRKLEVAAPRRVPPLVRIVEHGEESLPRPQVEVAAVGVPVPPRERMGSREAAYTCGGGIHDKGRERARYTAGRGARVGGGQLHARCTPCIWRHFGAERRHVHSRWLRRNDGTRPATLHIVTRPEHTGVLLHECVDQYVGVRGVEVAREGVLVHVLPCLQRVPLRTMREEELLHRAMLRSWRLDRDHASEFVRGDGHVKNFLRAVDGLEDSDDACVDIVATQESRACG